MELQLRKRAAGREGGQRREARGEEGRGKKGEEAGEAKRGEEVVVLCEATGPVNASRAPPDDVQQSQET